MFRADPPRTLEQGIREYPYLATYLARLESPPRFLDVKRELNIDLRVGEEANILYPLGKGIFVHIVSGPDTGRYNIIEPPNPPPALLSQVERVLARLVDETLFDSSHPSQPSALSASAGSAASEASEASQASEGLNTEGSEDSEGLNKLVEEIASLFILAKKRHLLKVKPDDEVNVLYHFLREKVGYGFLDGFLADPLLEDISIPGAGGIFIYHKVFGSLETNIEIPRGTIDALLRSISERYGKILSYSNPIVDIHLPDGSRFNIVFGEDISLKGSNFTIRKFPSEPISIAHLIKWNTVSPEMAAYLWILLDVGVSCMICGETASGKTTTLNAATAFIRHDSKIVSIEETPEVNLFNKNWVREVTRLHSASPVTMFDLLRAALRQRPDYIIIGEIRGEEGRIAFQAIETGHPVISTMHAGNIQQLFQRLTSDPINVPKSHINSLNLALFQARMERGRKLVRRVTSINEIIGYDSDEERLDFLPTFIYDSDEDVHRFLKMSFLLENIVLRFRGWGKERLEELYREMEVRSEILRYLAEEHPRYSDVCKTVVEVSKRGPEEVLRAIREGDTSWLTRDTEKRPDTRDAPDTRETPDT